MLVCSYGINSFDVYSEIVPGTYRFVGDAVATDAHLENHCWISFGVGGNNEGMPR